MYYEPIIKGEIPGLAMWRGGRRRRPDSDTGAGRASSEPRNVAPVGRPRVEMTNIQFALSFIYIKSLLAQHTGQGGFCLALICLSDKVRQTQAQ